MIVDPDAKLEEELVVRPTSETIIWNTYKKWIQSYRDLPIAHKSMGQCSALGNAYKAFFAYSRIFMAGRTYCTCHSNEAIEETEQMLNVYAEFAETLMAMPVIKGKKSEGERFAGAIDTYCIEAMMQDGKALQAGTSHFLGQNFAKAFDVKFTNKEGKLEYGLGHFLGGIHTFNRCIDNGSL